LEQVANEMVAGAAEATFGGLESGKGELLLKDHRRNAVAEGTEGVQAGRHHRPLPGGELSGQLGIGGLGGGSNLKTGGVNRM
jgi:hypothetical protein